MSHKTYSFEDGVIEVFQMPESTVPVISAITLSDRIAEYSSMSLNERHAEMERLIDVKKDIDMSIEAMQIVMDNQSSVARDMLQHESGMIGMSNDDHYFRLG